MRTRPPIVADDAFVERYIEGKKDGLHKCPTLTKLGESDRKYLRGMFDVFVRAVEPSITDSKVRVARTGTCFRYTPREMWNNIKRYFEVTIDYYQPLTITGIGTFNGISRGDLFEMLHKDKFPPEMEFLRDACKFVEMYNEYAAHKKMNPAGPIFILKNFGWKDKFEIEASSTQGALTDEERTEAQRRIAAFSER